MERLSESSLDTETIVPWWKREHTLQERHDGVMKELRMHPSDQSSRVCAQAGNLLREYADEIAALRLAVADYHSKWRARDELDCPEEGQSEAPLEVRQRLSREKAQAFHHLLVLAGVSPPLMEGLQR
jgi:hypothetical protein